MLSGMVDLDSSWVSTASVADLLAGYAAILKELRYERKNVRTNNAPVGDYAECLAGRALQATRSSTLPSGRSI